MLTWKDQSFSVVCLEWQRLWKCVFCIKNCWTLVIMIIWVCHNQQLQYCQLLFAVWLIDLDWQDVFEEQTGRTVTHSTDHSYWCKQTWNRGGHRSTQQVHTTPPGSVLSVEAKLTYWPNRGITIYNHVMPLGPKRLLDIDLERKVYRTQNLIHLVQ